MNKFDTNVINNLKMLSLDMIANGKSGNSSLCLKSAPILYTIMMKHLNFDNQNADFINRDRLIVSNDLLPLMYAGINLFTEDISLESLKDYQKLGSSCSSYAQSSTKRIEVGSNASGDVLATSAGIALGERYIEELIKLENPKCDLINYHTFCLCKEEDLLSGIGLETLEYVRCENLNKLIYVVIEDNNTKSNLHHKIDDLLSLEGFNAETLNNTNLSAIDGALEDAKISKKPTILIIKDNTKEYVREENKLYMPYSMDELNTMRTEFGIENPFDVPTTLYTEIKNALNKRLDKFLNKWQSVYEENLSDIKIKNIIDFLKNKTFKINFNAENIKINANYDEELLISNNKIFNLMASKSPFILNVSDGNFNNTKCLIKTANFMSKEDKSARNIDFGSKTLAMGGISLGLASLGFKVFVSTPLVNVNKIFDLIKLSTQNNYDVNFIFTQDNFIDRNYGACAVSEINLLRLIPNLITIKPADIDEVVGSYEILSNLRKTAVLVMDNEKMPKLLGTNPKYVMAGAYRILKEQERLDAIIVSSGPEVKYALKVAEDLRQYNFDIRVVVMPSWELFSIQTERYQNILLPKEIKTFTLEFSNTLLWQVYASGKEYALGLNTYPKEGTKAELLNEYNLDLDAIKTKIIEILKNN